MYIRMMICSFALTSQIISKWLFTVCAIFYKIWSSESTYKGKRVSVLEPSSSATILPEKLQVFTSPRSGKHWLGESVSICSLSIKIFRYTRYYYRCWYINLHCRYTRYYYRCHATTLHLHWTIFVAWTTRETENSNTQADDLQLAM
jgi:hypothetical protein